MRNTAELTGGKPIAVLLQSISGVSAINPLVAFYDIHGVQSISGVSAINPLVALYDIHGGKREVLFFYFVLDTTRTVPDTTRDLKIIRFIIQALVWNRLRWVVSKNIYILITLSKVRKSYFLYTPHWLQL
jgi:hypothetical protein